MKYHTAAVSQRRGLYKLLSCMSAPAPITSGAYAGDSKGHGNIAVRGTRTCPGTHPSDCLHRSHRPPKKFRLTARIDLSRAGPKSQKLRLNLYASRSGFLYHSIELFVHIIQIFFAI